MAQKSKRMQDVYKKVDKLKTYSIADAIEALKVCPVVKFDQTVDVALRMGVDPRKSDQNIRGTVSLPHGTGKKSVILVFAKGDKVKEALAAGADYAGAEELVERVQGGWVDFTAVIATPDMMREVGKLGKVLGPRGLMPTPKSGNVTNDVAKAVAEIKAGKVEFKLDKNGVINNAVGKLSFDPARLEANIRTFLTAIQKAKPATAKGQYMQALVMSSTMGPGLKIDGRVLVAD